MTIEIIHRALSRDARTRSVNLYFFKIDNRNLTQQPKHTHPKANSLYRPYFVPAMPVEVKPKQMASEERPLLIPDLSKGYLILPAASSPVNY